MRVDRREKVVSLLARIPDAQTDSLRVLAHALLNLAEDSGVGVLGHLRDQLPWIEAQLDLETGEAIESVADQLQPQLQAGFFSVPVLSELIATHEGDLSAICELEDRLRDLRKSDSQTICDRAFQSSRELALFGQLQNFPEVPQLSMRSIEALRILADLENRWERKLIERTQLSERSRRFEISAVDHLAQSGFLASVRAALAFGAERSISIPLDQFTVFQDDHTLIILARALATVRGRVLEHLKGESTLEPLSGWVEFLRGASADIAEVRGITHKEALSYVHFSFHLMNFCDLMFECGDDTDDAVRRSMMAIEDGLKEFAAMRVLPSEDTSKVLARGLGLRKSGDVSHVADRLARLAGHWKMGIEASGLGGLGQLPVDICRPWLEVLVDRPMYEREQIADFLTKAQFSGDVWAVISPESSVNLLVMLSKHVPEDGLIRVCLQKVAEELQSCSVFAQELDRTMSRGDLGCFQVHRGSAGLEVNLSIDPEIRAISALLKTTSSEVLQTTLRDRIQKLVSPTFSPKLSEMLAR